MMIITFIKSSETCHCKILLHSLSHNVPSITGHLPSIASPHLPGRKLTSEEVKLQVAQWRRGGLGELELSVAPSSHSASQGRVSANCSASLGQHSSKGPLPVDQTQRKTTALPGEFKGRRVSCHTFPPLPNLGGKNSCYSADLLPCLAALASCLALFGPPDNASCILALFLPHGSL